MRAIILANGKATRMGGGEKMLFRVVYRGEKVPLLVRTVEQLKARGVEDREIYIVSNNHLVSSAFMLSGVRVLDVGETPFMLVTWRKAMEYWDHENVICLGDVLWSEWAIDMMFEQTHYRRIGSASKHGGEGFGWKAFKEDKKLIAPHCDWAIQYINDNGPRPGDGGWQMYRHLIGVDPEHHFLDRYYWLDLGAGDYTMDFDFPQDYVIYRERVEPKLMVEKQVGIPG